MNIALVGYGKMGKMIEKAALEKGHSIAVIIDPLPAAALSQSGAQIFKSVEDANFPDKTDAAIEFTVPATAVQNIKALMKMKIPTIVGTTGWQEKLNEVTQAVNDSEGSLLWSSNFSLGVNIFFRIAWYAAQFMNKFPEYDIGGLEAHHNKKLDSPSGTARILVEGVLSRIDRKKKAVWETLDRAPLPEELHYPSLRLGSVPGTHSLIFDSAADTIEITHTARSREGLASGAVCAAEWLAGHGKREGVWTIDDMLKDMLGI